MIAILKRKPEPANDGPDWRTAREAVEQSERDQLLELFERLSTTETEYVGEHGDDDVIWKPDRFGVWHPCRHTGEDRMLEWVRGKRRRTAVWLRWGWKSDLNGH